MSGARPGRGYEALLVVFLVIGGSILAVNALHTLMRRGQATRVTSLDKPFAVLVD